MLGLQLLSATLIICMMTFAWRAICKLFFDLQFYMLSVRAFKAGEVFSSLAFKHLVYSCSSDLITMVSSTLKFDVIRTEAHGLLFSITKASCFRCCSGGRRNYLSILCVSHSLLLFA